jgi:hypothetical protein
VGSSQARGELLLELGEAVLGEELVQQRVEVRVTCSKPDVLGDVDVESGSSLGEPGGGVVAELPYAPQGAIARGGVTLDRQVRSKRAALLRSLVNAASVAGVAVGANWKRSISSSPSSQRAPVSSNASTRTTKEPRSGATSTTVMGVRRASN